MRFQKSASLASKGVWFIFTGIFVLFLLALYQYFACPDALPCSLRKSYFAHVNLFNIFMFAAFFTMFAGIVTELCGVFQISKAAQNINIFYNKLNLYLAAALYFALNLKSCMAKSDHFFLINIDVSRVSRNAPAGFIGDWIDSIISPIIFICVIGFLYKNSAYLSKVFYKILFKKRFLRWLFYVALTIIFAVLSTFLFRILGHLLMLLGILPLKDAFGLLNLSSYREIFTIITFFPYLASLLILYRKISKTDEVNEIVVNKEDKKVVRHAHIAIVVLFVITIFAMKIGTSAVAFVLFLLVVVPMIIVLPFSVIVILQSYNLTRIVICAAALETVFFWIFFFSPIYGILFAR
ncbi:MAG: hypothetical protein LBS26_06715 [Campylobacteraceae bacterium]|jgi:hypothetical protein|nr:hypothetical protein [Campylobacteraceae bacterium]